MQDNPIPVVLLSDYRVYLHDCPTNKMFLLHSSEGRFCNRIGTMTEMKIQTHPHIQQVIAEALLIITESEDIKQLDDIFNDDTAIYCKGVLTLNVDLYMEKLKTVENTL